MWTRKELKTRAKAILKISYWKAFLISLILAFVGGDSGGLFKFNRNMGGNGGQSTSGAWMDSTQELFPYIFLIFMGISIVMLLALAFRILLGFPLEVGGRKYFVRAAQRDVDMNFIGYAFDKQKYLDIIKAMFWRGLLNFLWFLLLIVPGIVKFYAYRMVPYILADNPNIGYRRAVELSVQMTNGQKFDMWVLDLSFIGWYLLGAVAFGIGMLFVMPYDNATKAELYLVLRQKALDEGLCSYEELRLNS